MRLNLLQHAEDATTVMGMLLVGLLAVVFNLAIAAFWIALMFVVFGLALRMFG